MHRLCQSLEVANQWANLYPCPNNTNQVFTCGTSGWVSSVCNANLGQYTWQDGNVTVPQIASSLSPSASSSASMTVSATSEYSIAPTNSPSSAVAATALGATSATQSSNSQIALGAGLGVGLDVPLLISAAVLSLFYVRTQRQIQAMKERTAGLRLADQVFMHGATAPYRSSEKIREELAGSSVGRSELA